MLKISPLMQPQFSSASAVAGTSTLEANSPALTKLPVAQAFGESKFSDRFFTMSERTNNFFDRTMVSSKNPLVQQTGRVLKTIVGGFTNHDYGQAFNIKGLGRIGIAAPVGAIATMVILFTMTARLYYAARRVKNGDRREIGDILRRDLPTLTTLVFLMDPLANKLTQHLQRVAGLQLTTSAKNAKNIFKMHGEKLSYTQLQRYYHFNTPKQVAEIFNNSTNHRGILNALSAFTKRLKSNELVGQVAPIAEQVKAMVAQARTTPNSITLESAQGLLNKVRTFEKTVHRSGAGAQVRDMVVNYARRYRHISTLGSLAVIIGILGFGVTGINEWWANYQYNNLRKKADQA